MRIEKAEKIKSVELSPQGFLGKSYRKGDTVVAKVKCEVEGHHTIYADLPAPPDHVDLLAIVTLDKDELKQLGLKSGWASIFGEQESEDSDG